LRFLGTRSLQEDVPQPCGVAALKIECLAKYASFVSPTRVRGAQTIILDLTDIEDQVGTMR
jgi:hypothetical protein